MKPFPWLGSAHVAGFSVITVTCPPPVTASAVVCVSSLKARTTRAGRGRCREVAEEGAAPGHTESSPGGGPPRAMLSGDRGFLKLREEP